MMGIWDERYAGEEYHFGTEPNAFLVAQQHRLKAGANCLAVADGEGRNGVWLAQQGLDVLSVDASPVALAKAQRLAGERGANVRFELADLLQWGWGEARYDVVVAIFFSSCRPRSAGQCSRVSNAHSNPVACCCYKVTRRANWNTAPEGRHRSRTCIPKHCCAKYSPIWTFCISPSMTVISARGRGIAVCRRSSTW